MLTTPILPDASIEHWAVVYLRLKLLEHGWSFEQFLNATPQVREQSARLAALVARENTRLGAFVPRPWSTWSRRHESAAKPVPATERTGRHELDEQHRRSSHAATTPVLAADHHEAKAGGARARASAPTPQREGCR